MRGKAALVVGLATGYVLGTRDGRVRYQQIKTQFNRIISDPRVQQTTAQATDLAKEKAPLVKDKLASTTSKATSKVSGKDSAEDAAKDAAKDGGKHSTEAVSGSDLPEQTTVSAPDLTHTSSETKTSGTSSDASLDRKADGDVDDEIVLTPPSPSPLAPGPTQTNSSASSAGGSNG